MNESLPTLYLLPISIAFPEEKAFVTDEILEAVHKIKVLVVENVRTARRALKKIDPTIQIENYEWIAYDKHQGWPSSEIKNKFEEKANIGLMSEAGCPAVADPGEQVVQWAHEMNYSVNPLVGPNSLLLALMASGLNGQAFKFNSYLPIEKIQRVKAIQQFEQESHQQRITQLFIETPYRSKELFEALLSTLKPSTRLCVALGLKTDAQYIKTQTIKDWKKNKLEIQKIPTVYLFLA